MGEVDSAVGEEDTVAIETEWMVHRTLSLVGEQFACADAG